VNQDKASMLTLRLVCVETLLRGVNTLLDHIVQLRETPEMVFSSSAAGEAPSSVSNMDYIQEYNASGKQNSGI